MLVLSRKIGESIRIAESIEVKVLQVRGGRVRLGLQAPADVPIYRNELSSSGEYEPQGQLSTANDLAAQHSQNGGADMKRLLIVDDSEVERRLTAGLLAKSGFQIDYAENGLDALDCLTDSPPALVLTDLVMPEMDGLELLRVIRRRCPDLPVILMTAYGNESMAVEALRQGAASYVPKAQRDTKLHRVVEQVQARVDALRTQERLMACLTDYHCSFQLENDPALIDALVNLVENSLLGVPLADKMTRIRVGVALEEALLNALYHGNLEIDEAEFEQARRAGTLAHLVAQRRRQAPYRDRRISVYINLTREGARFVVRDKGPGFPAATLTSAEEFAACFETGRCRGVTLMRTLMDEVVFNGRGNEVTLSKHFPAAAARDGGLRGQQRFATARHF